MPLPAEVLNEIKNRIDEAEDSIRNVEDVISDLRATGVDASKQEEKLAEVKEELRRLRLFYERQHGKLSSA